MIDPRLYQLVIEQTKDYALFVLDPQGHIMTWNLGARRLKGYAPDEIIGRHFSTFYTQQAVQSGWPDYELKVAAREGRFEDEGWRVRKDGSRFWANVVITALRDEDGKLLGFSKITRDLTDRRLHEEALRQSEERFRLLVEGVVDYAIFMIDEEGMVTSWNQGAQRIKGYTRDEILGKHFSRFYVPEDVDAGKPWEELADARRTGRVEHEGWRVRKNGERFWARVIVTALYDAEGEMRGYAKVTQDLTELRHIQDLEKAAKNISEFIAVLAHELRNPLAPIRSAVHFMAKAPPDDPGQRLMRETIERQSAQLARIVDDMLDISRITRGELAIERENVDMSDVVRRALETAAPSIQAGQHQLHVTLPETPLRLSGDAHRLTQLIANILNNAARYTPPGGTIYVSAAIEEMSVAVRVRDTGRGIAPEMLDRIFDMFVHGRPALHRIGTGLGIGLALSRRIAELHGGSLEAHSAGENQGAEFILRVPREGSTPSVVEKPVESPPVLPRAQHPRRILIVDDNTDAAKSLDLLLRSLGHDTRTVFDGVSALDAAQEFRPEIVLLDIGMPGMDGYEVAKRLRSAQNGDALKIIAITGWGQEADRARATEAGFDMHLVKPVDIGALHKALSQAREVAGGSTATVRHH